MPFGGAGMSSELDKLYNAFAERERDASELQIVPMGIFPAMKNSRT